MCDGCKSINLKSHQKGLGGNTSNVFTQNSAKHGFGGALRIKAPSSEVSSTGSRFINNNAEKDGGAVYMSPISYEIHGVWRSKGDVFLGNSAIYGSGGALALEGIKASFDENTLCSDNEAPNGGGGCCWWDALAP